MLQLVSSIQQLDSTLYRAVDAAGKTVHFRLSPRRNVASAKAFFRKAVRSHRRSPETIMLDGYTASHRAVRELQEQGRQGRLPDLTKLRSSRYLNNLIDLRALGYSGANYARNLGSCPGRVSPAGESAVSRRYCQLGVGRHASLKCGDGKHSTLPRLPLPRGLISHVVWLYFRFSLSFRDIEGLMASQGVIVTYETIR